MNFFQQVFDLIYNGMFSAVEHITSAAPSWLTARVDLITTSIVYIFWIVVLFSAFALPFIIGGKSHEKNKK